MGDAFVEIVFANQELPTSTIRKAPANPKAVKFESNLAKETDEANRTQIQTNDDKARRRRDLRDVYTVTDYGIRASTS